MPKKKLRTACAPDASGLHLQYQERSHIREVASHAISLVQLANRQTVIVEEPLTMTEADDPITLKDAAQNGCKMTEATDAQRRIWHKYNAKRYAADPQSVRDRVLAWQKANPEKANNKNRLWRVKNPEKLRWYNVRRTYGLTKEQWEAMFVAQGSVCAICGSDNPGASHGWHTDHIHGTKIVRGILCHQCNTMLGRAKDNPDILVRGAEYLKRHAQNG